MEPVSCFGTNYPQWHDNTNLHPPFPLLCLISVDKFFWSLTYRVNHSNNHQESGKENKHVPRILLLCFWPEEMKSHDKVQVATSDNMRTFRVPFFSGERRGGALLSLLWLSRIFSPALSQGSLPFLGTWTSSELDLNVWNKGLILGVKLTVDVKTKKT